MGLMAPEALYVFFYFTSVELGYYSKTIARERVFSTAAAAAAAVPVL